MPKSKTIHVKERSEPDGRLIATAQDYARFAQPESLIELVGKLRVEQLEADMRIAELQFTKCVIERDIQLAVNAQRSAME